MQGAKAPWKDLFSEFDFCFSCVARIYAKLFAIAVKSVPSVPSKKSVVQTMYGCAEKGDTGKKRPMVFHRLFLILDLD